MRNLKQYSSRQTNLALQSDGSYSRVHAQREHLLPTLFDRLYDDTPQRETEAPEEYAVDRTKMADIVRRDLAYLLNTVNIEDLIDRGRHEAAAVSTINFGMPSLSGSYLSSRKWDKIEQLIHRAIRDFEPRLMPESLKITPLLKDRATHRYNVLLFEIRGVIRMNHYPMAFLIQSTVDLDSNRLSLAPSG